MSDLSKKEFELQEKAYNIIWNHVKNNSNTEIPCNVLINQIGEIFNLTNFNSAGLRIDHLLNTLVRRGQIKPDGKFLYVVGDEYMSVSDFNLWLVNKGKTMNTETNTNEEKVTIISSEIADDLSVIAKLIKSRSGISLTTEQVIQHLIHGFKTMNPQGMYQQPFATYPGPNPLPVKPQMPMYPPGARWANNPNPNGISFEEAMRNNDNPRNRIFNPGSDDNNNMPVNKK